MGRAAEIFPAGEAYLFLIIRRGRVEHMVVAIERLARMRSVLSWSFLAIDGEIDCQGPSRLALQL
jgi:hypothetical protein